MRRYKELAKRLRCVTIQEQLDELNRLVLREEELVTSLVKAQLMRGVDGDGNFLTPYKSKSYAKFKKTLNPRGVTDLRLTGSFHENMFLVSGVPTIIWSYDEKTSELVSKYGKKLFELSETNTKTVVSRIKKDFEQWQRKRFLYL